MMNIGTHVGGSLPNNLDRQAFAGFKVPKDFGSVVHLYPVIAHTAGGLSNIYRRIIINWCEDGENVTAHLGDSGWGTEEIDVGVGVSKLHLLADQASLFGENEPKVDDFVGVMIQRKADDPLDTLNVDAYFIGVLSEYVRSS